MKIICTTTRLRVLLALCAFLAGASLTAAQTSQPRKKPTASGSAMPAPATAPAPALTAPQGLSIEQVMKMVEAKVSETIIVAKVKKNATPFDLSPDQLIALKKASASDALIQVLLDPSQPYAAPLAAPAARPEPTTPAPSASETQKTSLDIGVYIRKDGVWMEVQPEVVNWKTGGTIKSLASAGVVKKDLNGNLDGPSSRTSIKTPIEVLIVAPEGVAATEYQFLHLRVNKDYREFRSVTGGILNQRSGAMRDLIPFEAKKIASRNFLLTVPASMGAGEYGILPPGAGGSSTTSAVSAQYGKMFTFHIVE